MIKPFVPDAPGLTWKLRKAGWEARWQAQSNVIRDGWPIKSRKLATKLHEPLSQMDIANIQDQCSVLQGEMLLFASGGLSYDDKFTGTLGSLIDCYLNDKDSGFRKIRPNTRGNYQNKLRRLKNEHGAEQVHEIKSRTLLEWHNQWSDDGVKVSAGHSMIAMMRILTTFGATILDEESCLRVNTLLSKMRFEMGKPREERLTSQQVEAVRRTAHARGRPSIALAQAFQFECMLRQRDVIGEYVSINEPGLLSDVIDGNRKWLRGLRWNEIDKNLMLRHVTSKRQKMLEVDLSKAPMVVAELELFGELPTDGPVIVSERTGLPYDAAAFRREWRKIATEAGIPPEVRNMDSRAGAISEATDAGAELEHVRHAATHSDISMTQRYSRGSTDKIAVVQNLRAQHRNKGSDK